MLRYAFITLVLVHGLIHFMGFARAFGYGNVSRLTAEISKPAGLLWFTTAVIFIVSGILYILKNDSWAILAVIASVISQILIISAWKDARFGTGANLIILFFAIPAVADAYFISSQKKEIKAMLSLPAQPAVVVTSAMLSNLPPVVQTWLIRSGVGGKEIIHFVRLKQKGIMRTKPDGSWMPFTAEQYFYVDDPRFIWNAKVQLSALVTLSGSDKFLNGQGNMQIKLLSLADVANAGPDEKTNSASMVRYLAETCWMPTAALSKYLKWHSVDPLSAKVTMIYKGQSVSGLMKFAENGDLLSFEADRYMGNGRDARPERWRVEMIGYKNFQGFRIPYKSKVIWKLRSGDYHWATVELTAVEYNKPQLFD